MSDSDLIIETSTNQFKCLSSDDQTIHLHFIGLAGDEPFCGFRMSKSALFKILKKAMDDPATEKVYGSFIPNTSV